MAIKTYAKGSNTKLSANFNSSEFDCHGSGCCSSTLVDDKLVTYLQQIREHFGKPVNISSGYRCATHNKNIGGATNSRHSKGQAADIYINGVTPAEIAKYAESIGILGIGLYETNSDGFFVHVDTRETKSFWYGQKEASRTTFGGTTVATNNKIDTSAVKDTAADPKVIWDYFKAKGLNDFGIAGLMGNLYAESGLKPTNLQNTYEKKLGYTDAEYTAAVDQGKYTNFVKDSAGYGLAQWTYWSRKQNLLDFAQSKNKSIGDLNMQLDFLYKELSEGYKNSVLKVLCEAKSVLEASNSVLLKFERPADQSETVQNKRAGFGQTYYDKYAGKPATEESSKPATTPTTGTNTGGTKMKYNSSNKPLVCMQTNSTCYKGTRKMTVLGVLWHSTGANNPWLKRYVQPSSNDANYSSLMKKLGKNQYGNDWNHIDRQAGLNCWIGKFDDGSVGTVQTMPWNYRPWGCGSGSKGSCNDGWIQFEICEDALTDKAYFDKVYKEAVEITAYLCKMYNLNPKGTVTKNGVKIPVILDHTTSCSLGFGSNHGDVKHWFSRYGKTLDDVRNDVAKLMGESNSAPSTPSTPTTPSTSTMYRVRKTWKDAASQKGAYTVLENAKKCCDQAGAGYYVFDNDGKVVYPVASSTPAPSTPIPEKVLKVGDVIKLTSNATYVGGKTIPSWVFKSTLYFRGYRGEDVIFSTLKTGAITGVVKKSHIQGFEGGNTITPSAPTVSKFPYLVIINTDVLNVRASASTNAKITTQVKRGQVYTIVAEDGEWGKLKSGAGWIHLGYTKRK
jgi:hypothetical protein